MRQPHIFTAAFALLFSIALHAQNPLLQSGPMNGYSEMREVLVWVQTTEAAEVGLTYWLDTNPETKLSADPVKTTKDQAFIAKLIADQVEPGNKYDYEVTINGKKISTPYVTSFESQPLWQYRTDPPAFKMALGSCTYISEEQYDRPGKPYGGDYQIFTSIYQQEPNLMLWLGDNTYLREADWYSQTGIFHRYTHSRSVPELQPLLGSTHHYAIWDDHDFGPNDADRGFLHKDKTLKAFELFWGNPTTGLPNLKGTMSHFLFYDVEFFLLDNRYHRSPNRRTTGDRQILGEQQIEWLIDALRFSRSPFKMVAIGGQVLNTAKVYENYANYEEERTYLLKRIEEENIKGVIFLTGDRHHSELSKMTNGAGNTLYDLTVSPLTSGAADLERVLKEENTHRVEGTAVGQRNFATIDVSGPFRERKLHIKLMATEGDVLWEHTILQTDLYPKKK